ncbi:MAG TPA: ornithine cyclodeaminase family protein [Candidatus Binatia bacterium]|nr:ornithine cyclodeaminase family protein [Candidatus Binatia bacterium]
MLVLARADVERLLTPADVIVAVEAAFVAQARGRAIVPPRTGLAAGEDGVLLVMPAALGGARGEAGLGAKLVSVYERNRERGYPTLHAVYVLLEAATGRPLAVLEATALTGIRTGATSALAARFLARPTARSVACFGAGAQARWQLECLAAVRRIERVEVIGRDRERVVAFAATMAERLGVRVTAADDPRRAVREADVVTCATTSREPVVFGADLRPGVHVDLVGAFRPSDREADTEAVRRARVVVDTYAGALEEAGDILIPLKEGAIARDHIAAELSEVVTGARPGRRRDDEITLFKSVGWALEDLAAARLAYELARRQGVGCQVRL